MDVVLEAGEDQDEMIPFFSIASRDFDNDLGILKKVLHQFEQRTHSENAFKFSERATLAAGWWFYDVSLTRNFIQRVFQLLLPYDSELQRILLTLMLTAKIATMAMGRLLYK